MESKGLKGSEASSRIRGLTVLDPEMLCDASFAAKDAAWVAVAELFDEKAERGEITYKALADRICRSKSQVHKWLNSSSNVTLKSLGLLAAGLNADVEIKLTPHVETSWKANRCHPAEAAAATVACYTSSMSNVRRYRPEIPMKNTRENIIRSSFEEMS